jgi:hypothetical protein
MAIASKTVVYAALTGNLLIAAAKFTAAALTGSSAMLSEGVQSVVDTGNQVLLLYGMRRARQAPDDEHPFGHGKEIYFWSFVVALLIFSTGAGVSFYEGVLHLIHPAKLLDPSSGYSSSPTAARPNRTGQRELHRRRSAAVGYGCSSTDRMLPAGSLNHAISGPPALRAMPFSSVLMSPS